MEVKWSFNGKYLATYGCDKKVCIWKFGKKFKKPIISENHNVKITGLEWHPSELTICMVGYKSYLSFRRTI
jgi:WD40 repeat protein